MSARPHTPKIPRMAAVYVLRPHRTSSNPSTPMHSDYRGPRRDPGRERRRVLARMHRWALSIFTNESHDGVLRDATRLGSNDCFV